MSFDPLGQPADPNRLRVLERGRILSGAAYARAIELAFASPPPSAWRRFIRQTLLILGTLLVVSGIVYFFAYNWAELGRFTKFGLIQTGILSAAIGAWNRGLDRLSGRMLVTAAAILTGTLLAVYGQTYQTGADAHELLVGWALLITPWVLWARFAPLQLFYLCLWNVALGLWWTQVYRESFEDDVGELSLLLFVVNAAGWLIWEVVERRRTKGLSRIWMPRAFATLMMVPLVVASIVFIVEPSESDRWGWLNIGLLAFVVVFELYFFRARRPDLFVLASALAAAIAVTTTAAGKFFFVTLEMDENGLLLLAVLLLAAVAGVAAWLRAEGRRMAAGR